MFVGPKALPSLGAAAPLGREEAACNQTAWHVESQKSLPKTEMAGRHSNRAGRYHGRIGFTCH